MISKGPLSKLIALIGLLLLSGCDKPVESLPAEGMVTRAILSSDKLTVGETVTLTLTARHPAGSTLLFPNLGTGKKVVVRGRSSNTREIATGILESEELYQLTSFRVGDWLVTTNPVTCTLMDGTEKKQALPKLILQVVSASDPASMNALTDIKPLVKPPLQLSRQVLILLLVIVLAVIAGILTLFFFRKKRADAPPPPALPPHVTARLALDALRTKEWLPDPFFTELSLILRTYLENRFSLHAPELTTEELTRSLSSDVRLEIKEQQTLRHFMTQSDLVKFARADAAQEVMQTAFTTVEQFVEQTKQDPTDPVLEPQKNTKNAKGELS